MRVTVVGIGYVGLATAVFWAADSQVKILDVVQAKVDSVNRGECPFNDPLLHERLRELYDAGRPVLAELSGPGSYADADAIVVAVPTDYDPETRRFDTSIVESVVEQAARENRKAPIVLRSTVHPGFCEELEAVCARGQLLYSPEFLREGHSMQDCLQPSRVVIGAYDPKLARRYGDRLKDAFAANEEPWPELVLCTTREAEAAKLFANAYLACRVAFFNELDSYALFEGLDARKIIDAVCRDPRIGDYYNNPSFGYGGYCLPKDTKALLGCFGPGVPADMLRATVQANRARKDYIVETIAAAEPEKVGIYRLVMKAGSDNSRSSAMYDVVDGLAARGIPLVIYEPMMHGQDYHGIPITGDLGVLLETCDTIVANRMADELLHFQGALFTRDVFWRD